MDESLDALMDYLKAHSLSAKYPEKTRKMARLLTQRLKDYHGQMPLFKATGKPVLWPDEVKQKLN